MVKDRGAWYAAVHGVTKSWTQFSVWAKYNVSCMGLTQGRHSMGHQSLSLSLFLSLPLSVSLSYTHANTHSKSRSNITTNCDLFLPYHCHCCCHNHDPLGQTTSVYSRIMYQLPHNWGYQGVWLILQSFLNMWNITQPEVILKWSTFQLSVVNGDLKTFIVLNKEVVRLRMVRGAWQTIAHGVTKGWHNWTTNTHSACLVRCVMVFNMPGLDCRGPWQVPLPHTNCQAGFKQEGSNRLANPTEYLGFTCMSVP